MSFYPVVTTLRLTRVYAETTACFTAPDPWHANRLARFTVEDYVAALPGTTVPKSAKPWLSDYMRAIRAGEDGSARFLPDSLSDLYRDGQVPAEALPRLLKEIEADLIPSDFRPLLRSRLFWISYFLWTLLCTLLVTFIGLTLVWLRLAAAPIILAVLMLVGMCGFGLYAAFHRKLARRKAQKAHFQAALAAGTALGGQITPAATSDAEDRGVVPDLLSLDRIEQLVCRTAAAADVAPVLLPTYGRSRDFAHPHIEVDQAYHFVVMERGAELQRLTTLDLDVLQYWIFRSIFLEICTKAPAPTQTADADPRRRWFAETAERLGQINPDWKLRWEVKAREILRGGYSGETYLIGRTTDVAL